MREMKGAVGSRIAKLPHDKRGFPVPWFVAWHDGEPVFPAMDPAKLVLAIRQDRCWVCGEPLGRFKCFVAGPMCGINRVSAEPPSHRDCAEFSVRNCPFLTMPKMRRVITQDGTYLDHPVTPMAGLGLERNPGVSLIWTCRDYRVERTTTGPLMRFGEPTSPLTFWAQGRPAMRSEVDHSVATGLPALRAAAASGGAADEAELERMIDAFNLTLDLLRWPPEGLYDDHAVKAIKPLDGAAELRRLRHG